MNGERRASHLVVLVGVLGLDESLQVPVVHQGRLPWEILALFHQIIRQLQRDCCRMMTGTARKDLMFISVEDRTGRIRFSYNYGMSFTYSQ